MKKLTILLLLSLVQASAPACSCYDEFREFTPLYLTRYRNIFSGRVLSLDTISTNSILAKVKLERAYWGNLQDTVIVTTMIWGASCGYKFRLGESYLFYAWGEDKRISSCSPTRSLNVVDLNVDSVYMSINSVYRKYSAAEVNKFIKAAGENEMRWLDSVSRLRNGSLSTLFLNHSVSARLNIRNGMLSDTNTFYYPNGLVKLRGVFRDNLGQEAQQEYHYRSLPEARTNRKKRDYYYYSETGFVKDDKRVGLWRYKFLKGNRRAYKQQELWWMKQKGFKNYDE